MKKISKVVVIILAMAVSGTTVWASPNAAQTPVSKAQMDQIHAQHKHKHFKQELTYKVEGKANRGAQKVSPEPTKGAR